MSKIYDCFLFYNEMDLLEIRLNELYDVVEKFILIEASSTFTGKLKPFYFEEQKHRFDKFLDKIVHIKVNLFAEDTWGREHEQREYIKKLPDWVPIEDGDVVLVCDVDEIPDKKVLKSVDWRLVSGMILSQTLCYYYFNNIFPNNKWQLPKAIKWENLKGCSVQALRNTVGGMPEIKCGWHFSYLGQPELIMNKLEAFSHQEYKKFFTEDNIKRKLESGKDLFDRPGQEFVTATVPLDERFPDYVLKNEEKFAEFIKPVALKAYWFGYGCNVHHVENLRPLIEGLGYSLTTIHERQDATVVWNRNTWKEELKKADVVVIPCVGEGFAKSANKLIQAMALGKPVICSSRPAFMEIAQRYEGSVLIADSQEEWKMGLELLKHSELRKKMSVRAMEAIQDYSMEKIGKKWEDLLYGDKGSVVDIIIPTANNLSKLKLCIESIRECTKIPYNIILIEGGGDTETLQWLGRNTKGDMTWHHYGEKLTFAKAINEGVRKSKSEYVCFLNDDTIVSHGWLDKMVESAKIDKAGAVGVLSNCDKGWLHSVDIKAGDVDLLPGINTEEQILPVVKEIYNMGFPEHWKILDRTWIAFYCVLFPRKVLDEVGKLDESFMNSEEDVDYCIRLKKMGYKILSNFNAFVFHFGASTRKLNENRGEVDLANMKRRESKWEKPLAIIYSGASWEKWNGYSVLQGIGGSETWQVKLSEELVKLGYSVVSYCDCSRGESINGVVYRPFAMLTQEVLDTTWADLFISSRTCDPFINKVRAGKKLVMVHDIFINKDRNYNVYQPVIDYYLCLSEAHKGFLSDWHGIPKEKILITSNGIDFDRFNKKSVGIDIVKDRHRCIYSSSPDRGLENLLDMWPLIKKEVPLAELYVYYGFNNYWSVTDPWKKEMERKLKQPGIFYEGRVGQLRLAEEFMKSSVLLYPCSFEETFCITAIEAMAAGCVILSSNYWGLKDTVKDAGVLIDIENARDSYTVAYKEKFVSEAVRLLLNNTHFSMYQERGFERVKSFSWDLVAEQFDQFVKTGVWNVIQ